MYGLFRSLLLRLLRAPEDPPEPPAGSPGSERVFRASEKFLTLQLVPLGLSAAVALVPLLGATGLTLAVPDAPLSAGLCMGAVTLFVAAVMLLRYFLIRLDWDMRYYIVTDRSLRVRHGAMRIQEHTYTYANIQNLTIHQGPLERFFGLANVRVQTAGGGGVPAQGQAGQAAMMHGGVLRGIEDAEVVRDQILALLRAYRDAGLGDTDEASAPARETGSGGLSGAALGHLREAAHEARLLRDALDAR